MELKTAYRFNILTIKMPISLQKLVKKSQISSRTRQAHVSNTTLSQMKNTRVDAIGGFQIDYPGSKNNMAQEPKQTRRTTKQNRRPKYVYS